MVQGAAVTHPCGAASLDEADEFEYRRRIVRTAVTALEPNVSESTVFEREGPNG